jgi:hypothetical protein
MVLGVAVGTVVFFLEHRGKASCPRCGKPCAGDDAVDGDRFAVHRVPRGGRDRSAGRGGGVAERTDSTNQADGVRVPEPRALWDAIISQIAGPDFHPRSVSALTIA